MERTDPPLEEIRGPSALGGSRRRLLDLLYLIAVIEFRKTYFDTALGYVWSLARPLILFGVLLLVFTQVFRVGSQVPNYPVLLLLNIVLFSFFQEATSVSVTAVVGQEQVVRKTQFPRVVIPLAVVATAALNLCLNLIVVLVFLLAWGVEPSLMWLLFPLLLALLVLLTTTAGMLLSALYPRYRDLGIIWGLAATVLFYATPVLYPLEAVPPVLREVAILNPLTPLFVLFRKTLIDPGAPDFVAMGVGGWRLALSGLIFVLVCVAGFVVFSREAPRIAEEL